MILSKVFKASALALTLAVAIGFTSCSKKAETPAKAVEKSYSLTEGSAISWEGKKTNEEDEAENKAHTGTLGFKSATIMAKEGALTKVEIEFDFASLKCTDLEGGQAAGLVGHLSGMDFFDVDTLAETVPAASFVMKESAKMEKADEAGNTHTIKGDLMMNGMTMPFEFNAKLNITDAEVSVSSSTTFDRTVWGIMYGSKKSAEEGKEMKKYINDEVNINFDLKAMAVAEKKESH